MDGDNKNLSVILAPSEPTFISKIKYIAKSEYQFNIVAKDIYSYNLFDFSTNIYRLLSETGRNNRIILKIQKVSILKPHKNYYAELVLYPYDKEKREAYYLGPASFVLLYWIFDAIIKGVPKANIKKLLTELRYDNSTDERWFEKRICKCKTYLKNHNILGLFLFILKKELDKIAISTFLIKDEIEIDIDYEIALLNTFIKNQKN